jgi:hypothetical protein
MGIYEVYAAIGGSKDATWEVTFHYHYYDSGVKTSKSYPLGSEVSYIRTSVTVYVPNFVEAISVAPSDGSIAEEDAMVKITKVSPIIGDATPISVFFL